MMNLDMSEAGAAHRKRSGFVNARAGLSRAVAVEQNLHREIEALIPRLRRYARILTRDAVGADDLLQDCITRALGKIHLWAEGTDLRAWLFTILHHQYVSLARRDARQLARMQLEKSYRNPVLAPDQTARLELRDLERAIARLPEEQRSVILLVGRDGLGYDEAAAVVKLPVGTVRSRVSRGREALRTMTGFFPARHSPRSRRAANGPRAAVSRRRKASA
jgi:RNA polymerase sigma-70 factor, ECF subfamily